MEHVGWWIVVGFLVVAIGSILFIWRNRKHLAEPENMLVLFMVCNIFFVTAVGDLMDIGENNRFRFTVDPFILILLVFFLRNIMVLFSQRASDKAR
jgi:hypothetical protein